MHFIYLFVFYFTNNKKSVPIARYNKNIVIKYNSIALIYVFADLLTLWLDYC